MVGIFFNDYGIPNTFNNDRSAIMFKINYVDRNEPVKSFLNVF